MLVRSGTEGDWLPLRPLDGLPEGGVRAMCGPDVGAMLELDEAMPVVAWGPWPAGGGAGVDAVCLTQHGDLELVLATHGEDPRDTLWRLVDVAASLQGTTLEAFLSHCSELDTAEGVARWLERRCGADGERAEARLRRALELGEFGVVLLTPDGAPELTQPLALLARAATRVRAFTVQVLSAGSVFAVEATPSDAATAPAAASTVATAPHAPVAVPVVASPEPELVVVPEPEAWAPAPAPEGPAAAPIAEAVPEPVEELEIVGSDEVAFLAGVDRLDHRTSAHLRWLHDSLRSLVDEVEYTTDGELVHVTGWRVDERRQPLYGLDSQGLLQLVLTTLPREEQAEFASEVAALLPDDEAEGAALLAAGFAEVDVPACLDDQTLLEYLVDNLVEALPGGREAFGTAPVAPEAQADGADYFEGVSPAADPADVAEFEARLTASADELTRPALPPRRDAA